MNLASKETIANLLKKHGARPSKGMGQNFLIHSPTLSAVVAASELLPTDTVLEIGPGLGSLTALLAGHAKKVVAVEKDRAMVQILKETLSAYSNIDVIQENALSFATESLAGNYKVVANIPYYLTSPLIRKFLEAKHQPTMMVLMLQKEVAQRICAKPPLMSLLAVSVQFYAVPNIVSYVKKEHFWPRPKVDSAIIKILPAKKERIDTDLFFRIVKAGFSHPRKQLAGNLSGQLEKSRSEVNAWLLKNAINEKQRAETLQVGDWIRLARTF